MPRGKPRLKTETMTLRVAPEVKVAAELAAKRDRRSVTNFIEVLILNHCNSVGIKSDALPPKEREHGQKA